MDTPTRISLIEQSYDGDHDSAPGVPQVSYTDAMLAQCVKDLHQRLTAAEQKLATLTQNNMDGHRILLTPSYTQDKSGEAVFIGWAADIVNAHNELVTSTPVRFNTNGDAERKAYLDGITMFRQWQRDGLL